MCRRMMLASRQMVQPGNDLLSARALTVNAVTQSTSIDGA
jgi:hypothetical protein